MVSVSILILSYNRLEDLRKNVLLLCAGLTPEIEMIIVDNASTDGSREFLRDLQRKQQQLKIVFMDENMGVAKGRNAGFRLAEGDYVVSLDDDTCISLDDIRKVPELFSTRKQAGILAFKVCHALTGEVQNDHGDQDGPVANFHGAAHAIRKGLFARIGYLDELCDFGGEEFDFSVRCHAAGFQTVYTQEIKALHNSFPRPGPEGADRREKWVYNYVRILHKLFPARIASLYSFRYVYTSMRWGYPVYGFPLVRRLFAASLRGRKNGISVHSPVPLSTVLFYDNSSLRPEYGNVPIEFGKRIVNRFKRMITKT